MKRSKMTKIQPQDSAEKKLALYLRVSTDRQAEEGYSIEIQRERLTKYASALFPEHDLARSELYIDDGYSGGSLDRPEIKRLIADAQSRSITHVVVMKLDRLSRSQKDTLYLIEDVFIPNNIAFISMQESFDTSTPFGRAVVGILSVFAQLERENIFERTRSGMQKRVEQGYWMGGGQVPFGYDYDREQGILVPNADAEKVRQIYDMYARGAGMQTIANALGLKYSRLIYQIIRRKINYGVIEYNGKEYPGRHEPLVTEEVYRQAMELFRRRSEKHVRPSSAHLLSGLLYCGKCGAKLRYAKWSGGKYMLVCYSKDKSKPYLVRDPNCDNRNVPAEQVEDIVINDLWRLTGEDSGEESDSLATPLELLTAQRAESAARLKKLYKLYSSSDDELLRETIAEERERLGEIETELRRAEEAAAASKKSAARPEEIRSLRSAWPYLTNEERRAAIQSLVRSIVVCDGKITINYEFD